MKVAVLGAGKTGSKVALLLSEKGLAFDIFNSKNPPTLVALDTCDVIISFLPPEPFAHYIDLLIESKKPVVAGTTGFHYSDHLNAILIENKCRWIYGHNFSLGMNVIYELIQLINKSTSLLDHPAFSIHEIHHTKKLDAPSGTALSWAKWLGHPSAITSERTGDVIGFHSLELKTATEKIQLSHEALDRKIFAEGAIFAAMKCIQDPPLLPYGLTEFQQLIQKEYFSNEPKEKL